MTRKGVKVDRIASAWLVRRFLDARARFRFIDPKQETARPREITFDMVGGDFTHEGERRCSDHRLVDVRWQNPFADDVGVARVNPET